MRTICGIVCSSCEPLSLMVQAPTEWQNSICVLMPVHWHASRPLSSPGTMIKTPVLSSCA